MPTTFVGRARAVPCLSLALLTAACGGDPPVDDAVCGDGAVAASEGCDDGNAAAGDGCSPTCALEPGYVCEAGGPCRTPCGDGVVAGEEACDDGNTSSGDGCSSSCEAEAIVGSFSPATGADPDALTTSNEVTVNVAAGSLVTANVLGRFDEQLVVDGTERGLSARVTRGSQIAIRMSAPSGFADNRSTALLIEGLRLEWRISTRTSTFAWRAGDFEPCSTACGEGIRVRKVDCVDELDRVVDDVLCGGPAPPSAETCTDFSGCRYAYGPWTPWSACVDDVRTRSRACLREDGVEADCAECGGECAGQSACGVVCDRLGGSVIVCSDDQAGCTRNLMVAADRCRDAGCALAAGSATECTLGGFPGIPQCFGGQVICE